MEFGEILNAFVPFQAKAANTIRLEATDAEEASLRSKWSTLLMPKECGSNITRRVSILDPFQRKLTSVDVTASAAAPGWPVGLLAGSPAGLMASSRLSVNLLDDCFWK